MTRLRWYLCCIVLVSSSASAGVYQLFLGPPSLGQGGSNPVNIPPAVPIDWQFSFLRENQDELVVSLVPGIFYGPRFTRERLYASIGGGLAIGMNGLGPGMSYAFGFRSGTEQQAWRFLAEYRQVFALSSYGPELPYCFRLGVSYEH